MAKKRKMTDEPEGEKKKKRRKKRKKKEGEEDKPMKMKVKDTGKLVTGLKGGVKVTTGLFASNKGKTAEDVFGKKKKKKKA